MLYYFEVRSWAVANNWRRTMAALDVLADSFAPGELWGGCIGLCTGTFRNIPEQMVRSFSCAICEMKLLSVRSLFTSPL